MHEELAGSYINIPDGSVPGVTSVAVGVPSNLVKPSPVGVNDDGGSAGCATT
jgi:hypothetical protein